MKASDGAVSLSFGSRMRRVAPVAPVSSHVGTVMFGLAFSTAAPFVSAGAQVKDSTPRVVVHIITLYGSRSTLPLPDSE